MWVKLDDDFYHHPKIRRVGPLGIALQVAALCYANHFSTKGFISKHVLETLIDFEGQEWWNEPLSASKVAKWLVAADMWDEDEEAFGYWIHDYKEYQEPTLSEKRSEAGRMGGLAKSGKSHSEVEGSTKQASSKPLAKASSKGTPYPIPYPSPADLRSATTPPAPSVAAVVLDHPSGETKPRPNVYALYEGMGWTIGANVAETLNEWEDEYDPQWLIDVFQIGAKARAKNMNFMGAILEHWKAHEYRCECGKPKGASPAAPGISATSHSCVGLAIKCMSCEAATKRAEAASA